MKQTILLCDWCKPPRKFATGSLHLQNGRSAAGSSLDLCEKHNKEVHLIFKPRSHRGRPLGSKNSVPRSRTRTSRETILEALSRTEPRSPLELAKTLKCHRWVVRDALYKLQREGKAVRHGAGNQVKYTRKG